MISINDYKQNPCRLSSLPYWKMKSFKIQDNITVVHDEDYDGSLHKSQTDTLFFRLKHPLISIQDPSLNANFEFKNVDTTCIDDLKGVVDIINKSYTHIQVNLDTVISWTKSAVFDEKLWVFIVDRQAQNVAALGIGERDIKVREGMLEWIQVLSEYRGQKLGQAIVNKLLILLSDCDFVTVSGEVDNKTNPERLYRKCGFEGNDIWHIIKTKNVLL